MDQNGNLEPGEVIVNPIRYNQIHKIYECLVELADKNWLTHYAKDADEAPWYEIKTWSYK